MPTPLEFQLRLLIARYLAGQLSLEGFEDAFLQATWESNDPATKALVGTVELKLAELTNGHLTTDQLKTALRALNTGTGIVPAEFQSTVNAEVQGASEVAPARSAAASA